MDKPSVHGGGEPSYSAFISYSRRDSRFALWLHRRLEAFRFPAVDGRALTRSRRYPLRPAFRDIDELAASGDLGASIRAALAASNAVVLVCSPDAARSPWVNREVEHFISLGRGERILAVLVDGDPEHATENASASAAFPPALKGLAAEPLWVDARSGAESRERVFARIAAGLLNVSFDQVWKRKQRENRARAAMLTVAGVVIAAPLAYAGVELARPVAMTDCPIDSVRFVNAWTGDVFEAKRVGARIQYSCPEGFVAPEDYVEADHLTYETMCRGPYGEYVFDGVVSNEKGADAIEQGGVRWVYNSIGGAPCCFWDAPAPETVDEIISDPAFHWYPASETPSISSLELPVDGVEFGDYSTVETDTGLEGHTFTASICKRDIVRDFGLRARALSRQATSLFEPKLKFEGE